MKQPHFWRKPVLNHRQEEGVQMNTCLTRQLLNSEVSGCLVEKPECGYASQLGFSYLCRHPEHRKFNALEFGALTRDEINALYEELRQKRRDEFLLKQEEYVRIQFSHQSGFFGN
jgi:hypothetical protein